MTGIWQKKKPRVFAYSRDDSQRCGNHRHGVPRHGAVGPSNQDVSYPKGNRPNWLTREGINNGSGPSLSIGENCHGAQNWGSPPRADRCTRICKCCVWICSAVSPSLDRTCTRPSGEELVSDGTWVAASLVAVGSCVPCLVKGIIHTVNSVRHKNGR